MWIRIDCYFAYVRNIRITFVFRVFVCDINLVLPVKIGNTAVDFSMMGEDITHGSSVTVEEEYDSFMNVELDELEEKKIFEDKPQILGAKPSSDSNAIQLLVKWKKTKDIEFFSSKSVSKIFPQEVLKFYEARVEKETLDYTQLKSVFDELPTVYKLTVNDLENIKEILTSFVLDSTSYCLVSFYNCAEGLVETELLKKITPILIVDFYEKNLQWLDSDNEC